MTNGKPGTTFETGREIGILSYTVGPYRLGINLYKVREITRMLPLKAVPYSSPVVQGVFELRRQLVPAISLHQWLGIETPDRARSTRIIVANYLGIQVGFLVDNVEHILRVQWHEIETPERIQRFSSRLLGTIKTDDQLINLIDYEHIILHLDPEALLPGSPPPKRSKKMLENRKNKTLWVIEDSRIIRDFLKHYLTTNGYTGIIFFENPRHALEALETLRIKGIAGKHGRGETAADRVDLIISDIEMPLMDGYALVKTIKEDAALRSIPVILFSSFISSGDKLKGEIAAADAQLSKSESKNLLPLIDRFIFG